MLTRRALIAAAALTLAPAALAQTQKGGIARAVDLTGSYTVTGRNADGSGYSGTARITDTNGAVAIQWTVGGQSYSGQGIREGRVVTVNWGDATPVVYVLMPNGALHGTWADGLALDRLVPR
jgi:hypothetical protein